MPITRTAWIDDDGSGTTGTVLNNAEKSILYNQIDELAGGVWTPIGFSPANFVASGAGGGVWTVAAGNIFNYHWTPVSKNVALLVLRLTGNMTLSNTATFLDITLPNVPLATIPFPSTVFHYSVAAVAGTGYAEISSGKLRLLRDINGTSWPAFSSGYLIGQVFFPCG